MKQKRHRVTVTLDIEDLKIIQTLSGTQKLSMSSFIKRVVQDWLENYKIEEREAEKNPLIPHEEYWEIK